MSQFAAGLAAGLAASCAFARLASGGPQTPSSGSGGADGGAAADEGAGTVVMVMLSGKRGAGKDHFAAQLEAWLARTLPAFRVAKMAFADGCKEGFAKEAGLDAERLKADRDYKELHRDAMTAWYHRQTPTVFKDMVAAKVKAGAAAAHASGESLLILVTDCRLLHDMDWVAETAGQRHADAAEVDHVLTLRVETSDEVRARRGWVYSEAKDTDPTECELDSYPFALTLNNDAVRLIPPQRLVRQLRKRNLAAP